MSRRQAVIVKDSPEELVRVIINPSDGTQDQFIPKWKVRQLILQGVVCWDFTNGEYCSKDGKHIKWRR